MAVLEPRNFILPFSSTFNVAAILFVLFVFGIYRFALGRTNDASLVRGASQSHVQAPPNVVLNVPESPPSNAGTTARKPEDLIRELLSPPAAPPSDPGDPAGAIRQDAAGADGQKGTLDDNSLDDVEKALGLR